MHGVVKLVSTTTTTSLTSTTTTTLAARAVTVTAITIPVSECCQSNTPPVNFGPSSTFSTVTTSSTPSVIPSETSSNPQPSAAASSNSGSVHPAVIAGTVIGAVVLILISAFFFFISRRRRNTSATKRPKRRTIRMFSYPGEYQTVPVNGHPNGSPSHSPTPSSDSSLSTQGLLDMRSYANDQQENEYTYVPQELSTSVVSNNKKMSSHSNTDKASSAPRGDRRSVDTIFALRFYYTHELDRRSKGSFLAELPSSPVLPPVLPLPPTSPPPPPPPTSSTSPLPSRASRISRNRKTYVTPAGEPWKPLPPPAAPLPTVPPSFSSSTPPSQQTSSHHRRRSTNPTFSLFPKPPASKPQQLKPAPLNISKNLNSSRLPPPLKLGSEASPKRKRAPRSAPLNMNPITNSVRGHVRALGSAPLFPSSAPSSTPKIVLQQAQAADIPPTPSFPKPPKSAPLFPTNTTKILLGGGITTPLDNTGGKTETNTQGKETRFNATLLTPPIGTGEFAPPPPGCCDGSKNERGRISMKGIEGGRRIKSLPNNSNSVSPRRGGFASAWLERAATGWNLHVGRPRSPSNRSQEVTAAAG
ncbi:hypothetical protein QBC43DRAFT_57633 [Cladorrhinum sp. PSN259]|nr:hypothetical protein QBC43DRAFT_57633 [Cladorrhinum sp. PSN259]